MFREASAIRAASARRFAAGPARGRGARCAPDAVHLRYGLYWDTAMYLNSRVRAGEHDPPASASRGRSSRRRRDGCSSRRRRTCSAGAASRGRASRRSSRQAGFTRGRVLLELREQGGALHRATARPRLRRVPPHARAGPAGRARRGSRWSRTRASWRGATSAASAGCSSCGWSAWRMRRGIRTSPPCRRHSGAGNRRMVADRIERLYAEAGERPPIDRQAPGERSDRARHRARGAEPRGSGGGAARPLSAALRPAVRPPDPRRRLTAPPGAAILLACSKPGH